MADDRDDMPVEGRHLLTRRSVLNSAGLAIAAAALPACNRAAPPAPETAAQEQPTPIRAPEFAGEVKLEYPASDVMIRLSTYLAEARERLLPDKVLEKTKWHVLDTFAAIVSGKELEAGRAGAQFAGAYVRATGGGKGVSTIIGDTTLCGPIEAALVNGTVGHADETDDSWPSGWHPGCIIVPASLSVGEMLGVSGMHFLRAVALGYDIGSRMILLLRPLPPDRFQSSHATCGIFGAAAAAGCAASLSAQQMRWVLAYTVEQRAGTRLLYRDIDHVLKGFTFGGLPARSGVTAALLVHSGWNAIEDVLVGHDNFLLANAPKANPEVLVEGLGERYEILATTIKKWTVGSPVQVTLDGMEALLKKQPIDPNKVQQVIVRSGIESPMRDINIQYIMSLMLIDKTATFRSIHDKKRMYEDEAIRRLREKVRLEEAPPGTDIRSEKGVPLIEITLTDGTRLTQDTLGPVLGTRENPMNQDQVAAKARSLMTPVLGSAQTTRLIDSVLSLEKMKDIRELRPLLQAASYSGPPRLSNYPEPMTT